jgi:hypothetical protein
MSRTPSSLIGHKEWAPGRKSDPRHDMGWRRAQVARAMARPAPAPAPQPAPTPAPPATPKVQEDEMYAVVSDPAGTGDYGTNGLTKFPFRSQEAKNDWALRFGAKRIELGKAAFDDIPTVKPSA